MKFKSLALLICSLIFVFVFTACGTDDIDPSVNSGNVENLIFGNGTVPNIVKDPSYPADLFYELYNTLGDALGSFPKVTDDSDKAAEHEIVIGRTNREISIKAYEELEKREVEEGELRYLIYSDGSSVAIVYDEDSVDAALICATEYFIENYVKDTLILEAGTAFRSKIDFTEFVDKKDNEYLNERWASLEAEAGKDIADAIKGLYEVFGDGVIEWFANLYDPGIGGYYYSNSGRDGFGFLPDVESTVQALGYIVGSGMLMQTGESGYGEFIPEDMKDEVIRFVKGLQDPADGYFYHPQWGKSIATSRKSRDLDWAISILKNLGSAPTYNAPNGTKGDGILPDGTKLSAFAFTESFATSKVCAVSKVVSVNAVDPKFESAESFMQYVEKNFGENGSLDIRTHSYPAGNELTSLTSVIVARDRELAAAGEETIAPLLTEWLSERQNEFGHWHYTLDENSNYIPLTNYYASNGLLKITGVYHNLGYKMPRTLEAAETAIAAITSDEEMTGIVDIYNTWFSLNQIRRNISTFGGDEGKKEYSDLQNRLFELAPSAIMATKSKLAEFRKMDDSFSYMQNASAHLSQNAPVAVPGTNEGDINATAIAKNTVTDLYGALGLSDFFVPLYTRGDAIRYKELLENLNPFEKPTIDFFEPDVLDSSHLATGEYNDISSDFSSGSVSELNGNGYLGTNYPEYLIFDNNSADIAANIQTIESNSVLEFKNYHHQRDPMLMFYVQDKTVWDKNDSYIIETDFLYDYGTRRDGDDVFQMFLLTDRNNAQSIWNEANVVIKYDTINDSYTLQGFGKSCPIELCKWYNMRIEVQNTRSGSASLRLYINGELLADIYAQSAVKQIDAFAVRHRYDVNNGKMFFDNTYVNSVKETDEEFVDPNTYVEVPDYTQGEYAELGEGFTDKSALDAKNEGILSTINTGKPESGYYGIYFENYEDSKAIQYAKDTELDGDNVLEFGSLGNGDPYLVFPNTGAQSDNFVLEFDFRFDSLTSANGSGNYFVFYLSSALDKYTDTNIALNINKNAYDEFILTLGSSTEVVKLSASEWYNIRLEITDASFDAKATLIVNGTTVSSLELGISADIKCVLSRFAWSERSGKVYFDNIYFGNINN